MDLSPGLSTGVYVQTRARERHRQLERQLPIVIVAGTRVRERRRDYPSAALRRAAHATGFLSWLVLSWSAVLRAVRSSAASTAIAAGSAQIRIGRVATEFGHEGHYYHEGFCYREDFSLA